MSLTLIEIDGQLYHAQDIYDEEGENVIDTCFDMPMLCI